MKKNNTLNQLGNEMRTQLLEAKKLAEKNASDGPFVNVTGVGKVLSTAYEQLRNAAEYAQEHLLRQRAIRRFYSRNLAFHIKTPTAINLGEELIIELTQAGYLENDALPLQMISTLNQLIDTHYKTYWKLRDNDVKRNQAVKWMLELLSVETERQLEPDFKMPIYVHFAFQHYLASLKKESFLSKTECDDQYQVSMYVAVHKALLKSDLAIIRADLLQLYKQDAKDIEAYIQFNHTIDDLYQSPLTDKIMRYINKYGAPLRVFKNMLVNSDNVGELIINRNRFATVYDEQIDNDYVDVQHKINKGIIKSVIFLLITKGLVGLLIEIPYDLLLTGAIAFTPLVINLLFPVLYMASIKLSLKVPSGANTRAIKTYMERTLYEEASENYVYPSSSVKNYSTGFGVVYALMFIVVFGIAINLLAVWGFNIIQGLIFFIFLSTASFLGFRLSRLIRELEIVNGKPSFVSVIRDFSYTPFILLGQWLSDRYSNINIVTLILDTAIELPLKTMTRLVRQWINFLNDKRDLI